MILQSFRCSFVGPLPYIRRFVRSDLYGISRCSFSCVSPTPTSYVHLTFVPWPTCSSRHAPFFAMYIWRQIVFRWYCISSPVSMGSSMSIRSCIQFDSSIYHIHLLQRIHFSIVSQLYHKRGRHMLGNQTIHVDANIPLLRSWNLAILEIPT